MARLLLLLLLGAGPGAAARLNVVMVAVDDLRTELSIYPEGKHMHTPNLHYNIVHKGILLAWQDAKGMTAPIF